MQPPAISYGHYKCGRKSNHSAVVDTEVNKSATTQEGHVVTDSAKGRDGTPPSMVLSDCHTVSLMAILKMLAQSKDVPNTKSQWIHHLPCRLLTLGARRFTTILQIPRSVSNSQRRCQRRCQEADNVSSQLAVSQRIG